MFFTADRPGLPPAIWLPHRPNNTRAYGSIFRGDRFLIGVTLIFTVTPDMPFFRTKVTSTARCSKAWRLPDAGPNAPVVSWDARERDEEGLLLTRKLFKHREETGHPIQGVVADAYLSSLPKSQRVGTAYGHYPRDMVESAFRQEST